MMAFYMFFFLPSLFTAGERSSALPDDSMCNVARDSHLFQPSYNPDPLPLYCSGLLKGFYFSFKITFLVNHVRILAILAPDMKQKGKTHVTPAPGLFAQKADCDEVDVSQAEHEALIRVCM